MTEFEWQSFDFDPLPLPEGDARADQKSFGDWAAAQQFAFEEWVSQRRTEFENEVLAAAAQFQREIEEGLEDFEAEEYLPFAVPEGDVPASYQTRRTGYFSYAEAEEAMRSWGSAVLYDPRIFKRGELWYVALPPDTSRKQKYRKRSRRRTSRRK